MKKTNESTGKFNEIIINKLLALLVCQIPTDSTICCEDFQLGINKQNYMSIDTLCC